MKSTFFENVVNHSELFLNPNGADAFFLIKGDDGLIKRIPTHKKLLVNQSKVFKAMFDSDLKEKGDISLTGVSFGAFVQFLEYFYLNPVKITLTHAAEVMILGDQYDVEKCVYDCSKFLIERINNENVLNILHHAIMICENKLVKSCEKYFTLNTLAVFKSTEFLESHKIVLEHILKMDYFSCCEVQVFHACMEWVKAKNEERVLSKENVKRCLGDLFYEIRFASMSVEELCNLPAEYDPILSEHFQTIAKMMTIPGFKPRNFNTNLRQMVFNKNAAIEL